MIANQDNSGIMCVDDGDGEGEVVGAIVDVSEDELLG